MLNEPTDLILLKQLQEASNENVDEERGFFKKGDKATYNMLGGGLTDSDLIRTLGVTEHIIRANHDGTLAEIVEASGEKVARYNIMFEDGFVINGVAASELKSVSEAEEGELKVGDRVEDDKGNTGTVQKAPVDPMDLDKVLVEYDDTGVRVTIHISRLEKIPESKTNEAEDATQTMKPQEKPNINAEDLHMEDYSEDDLEKVKSKSAETGDAIRQVDDKELKIEPDKVVTPKKESKLKEQEEDEVSPEEFAIETEYAHGMPGELYVSSFDPSHDRPDYTVEPTAKGIIDFVQEMDFDNPVERIFIHDSLEPFVNTEAIKQALKLDVEVYESKLKEETEFTPSRAEASKISDEKLRNLHKTALQHLTYWEKDKTAPEKVEAIKKAIERYEEMLADRGLVSGEGSSEKKESRFSFMKKQKPLWLCNECFKTFRGDIPVCTLCESNKVEKILEQTAGFTKEVFQVTWEDTETGKEESTRVMAFDKADAKREAKRSNRKITKVEGPITEEPRKENKVPFDESSEGSKLHETVRELVGEVSGISKEEQEILIQAIEKGDIPNTWPSDETMIDALAASETASKIHSPEDIHGLDMGEIRFAYLKYILLPKAKEVVGAARESKLREEEEDWDLSFMYRHNLIWHNPLVDHKGNPFIWQKQRIEGKKVRVFTDYQADWIERNKAIPVKVDYEPMPEKKEEDKHITAIEIVTSQIDPEAYNIRVVELPEGSIVILDSVSDKEEAIKRGKEFARVLNAKFLGIVDERKVNESMPYEEALKIAKQPEDYMEDQISSAYQTISNAELTDENKEEIRKALSNLGYIISKKESKLKEQEEDRIPGGKASKSKPEDFDPEQLKMGIKVEMEHTKDPKLAKEIAMDHLKEFPNYYTALKKMEDELKAKKESKLKEQEEDSFQTIAKGITDKADADKLAKEKEGQVIQDEDDKTRFAVLVRAE